MADVAMRIRCRPFMPHLGGNGLTPVATKDLARPNEKRHACNAKRATRMLLATGLTGAKLRKRNIGRTRSRNDTIMAPSRPKLCRGVLAFRVSRLHAACTGHRNDILQHGQRRRCAGALCLSFTIPPTRSARPRIAVGSTPIKKAQFKRKQGPSHGRNSWPPSVQLSPRRSGAFIWVKSGTRMGTLEWVSAGQYPLNLVSLDRPIFPHFSGVVGRSSSMATERSRLSRRCSL